MTSPKLAALRRNILWPLVFIAVATYVALRMGASQLWMWVQSDHGQIRLPATFATVDHPFHTARAEMLWRHLANGDILRWIAQHQGGYPAEFYPLGEAWLEVAVRALSFGALPAEGAHTLAVIILFLLPGVVFVALTMADEFPVVVAFLALCLHIALPGSWYHGGYTELVQWALVTNVAGAVATFALLPTLVRFVRGGAGWWGAAAAVSSAAAVYCNPRSLLGLAAVGGGVALAAVLDRSRLDLRQAMVRILVVAVLGGLLAAPELMSFLRFGDLYTFVHYSGYARLADYLSATIAAISWPVVVLTVIGFVLGLASRRVAFRATATSLLIYVAITLAISFVPLVAQAAPQLEPTRLMPLQRFLSLYLAAVAFWAGCRWIAERIPALPVWSPVAMTGLVATTLLLVQTRPLPGSPPDPASPQVPAVSLYSIEMSAQPQQVELKAAIRAADAAMPAGTALLVLGSALSWHQQLWAPLWTDRPLFYDNWLWFWHPFHAGTPGYVFDQGHHYPDPAMTLTLDYLERHGIGGVVVTGAAREAAATSPDLRLIQRGTYDAYVVRDPTTIVSTDEQKFLATSAQGDRLAADAPAPATSFLARVNWFPRWTARIDDHEAAITRRADGYIEVRGVVPGTRLRLDYAVQPLDQVARLMTLAGVLLSLMLVSGRVRFSGRG